MLITWLSISYVSLICCIYHHVCVLGKHDGQKRRRLESAGQENRSPTPSVSGRRAELEVKPDTPAITSVRSRLELLSQTHEGEKVIPEPGQAKNQKACALDQRLELVLAHLIISRTPIAGVLASGNVNQNGSFLNDELVKMADLQALLFSLLWCDTLI